MQPPHTHRTPQLTIDIHAASLHIARPSMDSGYASSMASSRAPAEWQLSRMYENWKIADAATQRLLVDLRALSECEDQLREATKRRNAEKNAKQCVLSITPGRRGAPSAADRASNPSTHPSAQKHHLPPSAELISCVSVCVTQIAATQPAAERLDGCFDELRRILDDGRPASWRSSGSSSSGSSGFSYVETYRRARRTVATRDEAYAASKSTTKALQRARIAIQSSHSHYREAMNLLDAVCSPNKSRWEAFVGDEQSRQETYREAAKYAEKAQICYNECIRALQPHWDLLQREELEACEDLKEAGLLQALQLYTLMYGGKVLAMGITQQVQIMVHKQEAVFQRLTSIAVWVQNCTRHCETVELETRARRDAARRELVALWVRADEDSETFSLVAPGEHAHVFQPTLR
ncbi:hypothetical protein GY45DRAFT_1347188 [Cubamyces sp. BRFM 1775]|nr:hypothetical protein GY45DRAFT_1347188 [Cubamyces sp. BRFM 1775]